VRSFLVVVLLAPLGCGPALPTAGKEGLVWEYKDLVEHLKNRGLAVSHRKVTVGSEPGIVLMMPGAEYRPKQAIVVRRQTAKAAAAAAEAGTRPGSFSWGRFIFFPLYADDERNCLPEIKAVLR
jgi:hypothetical protein